MTETQAQKQTLTQRVTRLLHEHGAVTPRSCAEKLGVELHLMRGCLYQMERHGTLKKEKSNGELMYFINHDCKPVCGLTIGEIIAMFGKK